MNLTIKILLKIFIVKTMHCWLKLKTKTFV